MSKRKREELESQAPAAAAASASDEKKGRGRPVGSKAKPVIDRLLAEDPLACVKLWEKWGDKKTLVQLPPPYNGNEFACWRFTPPKGLGASVNPSKGYGEISPWGRENTRMYMHVLSHFIHTGEKPVPKDPKQDISHRCHRKYCFNPAHLVRETVDVNGSRDYCHGAVQLGGVLHNLCPHSPACLRPGVEVENFVIAPITPAELRTVQTGLACAASKEKKPMAAAAAAAAADDT